MYHTPDQLRCSLGEIWEKIMAKEYEQTDEIRQLADGVAESKGADILLFNGPLYRPADQQVIRLCRTRRRRSRVILILVSQGGIADCAFRVAKCLQKAYPCFESFISGYCKSAATLVTLGANSIYWGDSGELGPLDVQVWKPDSLWEERSGLTVIKSLEELRRQAFDMYEHCFLEVQKKSGGRITAQTASEAAVQLVKTVFEPISGQIDPMHIGEVERANQLGIYYGLRLNARGENLKGDDLWEWAEALTLLVRGYPSHGFVIDFDDARNIFKRVEEADSELIQLADKLGDLSLLPISDNEPRIEFLSQEMPEPDSSEVAENVDAKNAVSASHKGKEDDEEDRRTGPGDDPENHGVAVATDGRGA